MLSLILIKGMMIQEGKSLTWRRTSTGLVWHQSSSVMVNLGSQTSTLILATIDNLGNTAQPLNLMLICLTQGQVSENMTSVLHCQCKPKESQEALKTTSMRPTHTMQTTMIKMTMSGMSTIEYY